MSFSSEVKTELCRAEVNRRCCALAEAYGVLLYANSFSLSQVRVMTESDAFAARLPRLFRRAFGLDFDALPPEGAAGKRSFLITDTDKLRAIFAAFGYDPDKALSHHINLAVVEQECDRVSFLRGAFLAGGSVTDPHRSYHMELATGHESVCRETHALLLEMGFEPRDAVRGRTWITYFKRSEAIEDLLVTMGASVAAMGIMEAKAEKHMANAMNRLTNCDMANADKITVSAAEQLAAIRTIEAGPGLDALPQALQETALLRIANPAGSISDLAQLAYPPVTKSCMNHRLRKLMELSRTME